MTRDTPRREYLALAGANLTGSLAGCLDLGFGGRDGPADSLPKHLNERVPKLLEYYDVPGASIALVKNGEVTWTEAYGEADSENRRPTTTETIFRVASITKSVTAWGVLTLVERGEIGLDDPVERHVTRWELPEAEFDTREVTVRRLLSHTSGLQMGLPDEDQLYAPGEAVPAPEEVLAGKGIESAAEFEQPPGTEFSYSNAGFVLLEILIEEVSGREYETFMREEILEPLGMDDATFTWDEEVASDIATGYYLDGGRAPVFVDPVKAPGGLYATAEDIARFVAAATEGPDGEPPGRGVLEPETLAEIHGPAVETTGLYGYVSDGYGLGHFVETLSGGQRAVWHGGQHTGWLSHYHCVPVTGDGIVVLTNSERSQRLLGEVAGAWAEAQGLSSVAMSRTYSRMATGLKATIGVAGLATAGLIWRLGRGLRAGEREFHPLARWDVKWRAGLGAIGFVVAGLWWGLGSEVLPALLPVLANWMEFALTAFVILVVLTVLFPRSKEDDS
ncbi:serine hydrolase domain-containing protein [Halopiger aswanensis]|uniref:CubicO group peptidase (Beta-lactamase class C family) n=1 Tax=Halopiger aswanensis TaxID=148449 RepID=A0A419W1B9_9EURY|nr:serine hydrolase domain-containing protein [Halopiger aswanensis]RKD89271.1 CubicO group peptidase (beta-lactamase class C family) [Halopiger aswanensis]